MRITIFGANGGTGQHLIEQATEAGHDVTAVTRTPLHASHPRLTTIHANVMDSERIEPAVAGADAVITAIGPKSTRKPTGVQTDSTAGILRAMDATGARRLVVISNSGMFTDGDDPLTKALVKPVLRRILRHTWDDMWRMEQLVRASPVEWTIARPPMLTNGRHSGRYRTAIDRNVRGGIRLSRADLADCVLHCLTRTDSVGAAVAVAR